MNSKKLDAVQVWKQTKKRCGNAPLQGSIDSEAGNTRKSGVEPPHSKLRPYKIRTMVTRNKEVDAGRVWKQMEDLLAPQLNFSLADRVIYSHLFRHSRLEGKPQLQFSISWLARGVGLSSKFTRDTVRRLIARGVLHLVECNCRAQHVVRVRLPLEVKGVCAAKIAGHLPGGPGGASACTRRGYQHRGGGFPGKAEPARGNPRARGRPLLLLFAEDRPAQAVPRPRCAASGVGTEFLSKPCVLLFGMQLAKGGPPRRRVSAEALPRAPFKYCRADWPPPRLV
jgi:hypothetical protein